MTTFTPLEIGANSIDTPVGRIVEGDAVSFEYLPVGAVFASPGGYEDPSDTTEATGTVEEITPSDDTIPQTVAIETPGSDGFYLVHPDDITEINPDR